MTKNLPRFELPGRQPGNDLHKRLRPIPSSLAAVTPEAAEHERLAERYGEANAAVIALERKVAETERAEEDAARKAIECRELAGIGHRRRRRS